MTDTHTARCFCGAVEIQVNGAPEEMGYCHCASCRAYSGEPFSTYCLWQARNVNATRGAEYLGHFNKTGMSERQFCTRCGGHLMTHHPELALTDLRAGTFPNVEFVPTVHLNYSQAVRPMRDGLPKLHDFPAISGGSGKVIAE